MRLVQTDCEKDRKAAMISVHVDDSGFKRNGFRQGHRGFIDGL